jgi:hypothetical protein
MIIIIIIMVFRCKSVTLGALSISKMSRRVPKQEIFSKMSLACRRTLGTPEPTPTGQNERSFPFDECFDILIMGVGGQIIFDFCRGAISCLKIHK